MNGARDTSSPGVREKEQALSVEIVHRRENPSWIAGLDFGSASFGCRTELTQLIEVELPLVDWTVIFLVAPMSHGLNLLRVYRAFGDAMHQFFTPHTAQGLDDRYAAQLERVLRQLKIPKRSINAYQCFGVLPQLWGKRYFPKEPTGAIPNRLNSILMPSGRSAHVIDYLSQLAETFGKNCIAKAPENTRLWIDQRAMTADAGLFLGLTSRMGEAELEGLHQRLSTLVESGSEREAFEGEVDPSIKIAGAVRAPFLMDILEGAEAICSEIARLRLELAKLLRWPHALEKVQHEILEGSAGNLENSYLPWLDEALLAYPVIHRNPFE